MSKTVQTVVATSSCTVAFVVVSFFVNRCQIKKEREGPLS